MLLLIEKMTRIFLLIIFVISVVLTSSSYVLAQEEPRYPTYIVQPGETLTQIAQKFGVSLNEMIQINGIINADLISAGTILKIPGLEGVQGLLITEPIGIGESLTGFIRSYHSDENTIVAINKLVSPNEVYVGTNLIIPILEDQKVYAPAQGCKSNQSALEISLIHQINPYLLTLQNNISSPVFLLPQESIFIDPKAHEQIETSLISPQIRSIELLPLPIVQGRTAKVIIKTQGPAIFNGELDGYPLQFFYDTDQGFYYTLQGIHAFAKPGLSTLRLEGNFDNDIHFFLEQNVLLLDGNFLTDPPIFVKDETIDPTITQPEEELVRSIISQISSDKLWDGNFRYPVDGSVEDDTIGFMSVFGSRRSYNNSDYNYFHTGLDFGVFVNSLNIYAAAPGRVVFSDSLIVRGITTFIDHGQGIFSGYFHQKESLVQEGDFVQAGQLIGYIGNTGRVTGPHLHWEIWVNGVQINPVDWVLNSYP